MRSVQKAEALSFYCPHFQSTQFKLHSHDNHSSLSPNVGFNKYGSLCKLNRSFSQHNTAPLRR